MDNLQQPGVPYHDSGPQSPFFFCSLRLWVSWEVPLLPPHQAVPLLQSHQTGEKTVPLRLWAGAPSCARPPPLTTLPQPQACTSYSFSSVQLISSKSPIRLAAGRRWSKKMENSSCRWSWPLRRCHICVLSYKELCRER